MAVRTSSVEWKGTLKEGAGTLKLASGAYEGPYTFASRFESGPETNPEELIGVAHAGCYSMFLSALLSNKGFVPIIRTTAAVHLEADPRSRLIRAVTRRPRCPARRGHLSAACRRRRRRAVRSRRRSRARRSR